ncbi:hypothetical protein [Botrimarina mediterranea]|uniref:hypothetical protein n=1 Tax=Botrimarina mediterranea TaxID=2528022 RepID=UPI0011878256|nr:hypothetical protein K2D_05830 [Planctomycetes bacterium K2D]
MAVPLLAAPMPRLLDVHCRRASRESYGDIPGLIEAARRETAEANLGNAWALYEEALAAELLRRWIDFSGKATTPIRDIPTLRKKLQSAQVLDRWTFDAIVVVTNRPKSIGWRHLDTVAALVTGICLENNRGGIACRA